MPHSRKQRVGFLLVLPTYLILLVVTIIPFIYALGLSLSSYRLTGVGSTVFVGLRNYWYLLRNPAIWHSLRITLIFTVSTLIVSFLLGLSIAMVLNKEIPGRNVWRTFFIIPMITSPIVVGLMWKFMFNYTLGIVNYFLGCLGILPQKWIAGGSSALPSLVIIDVWQWTPFVTVLCLAGLQSLPREPYEAAKIDGAGAIQNFFYVTLPMLKPVITIVLLIRAMDAFKCFDVVYAATRGGPGNATELMSFLVYEMSFRRLNIGRATALSFLMLCIVVFFSYTYSRVLLKET